MNSRVLGAPDFKKKYHDGEGPVGFELYQPKSFSASLLSYTENAFSARVHIHGTHLTHCHT